MLCFRVRMPSLRPPGVRAVAWAHPPISSTLWLGARLLVFSACAGACGCVLVAGSRGCVLASPQDGSDAYLHHELNMSFGHPAITHRETTRLLHRQKSSHGHFHLLVAAVLPCEDVITAYLRPLGARAAAWARSPIFSTLPPGAHLLVFSVCRSLREVLLPRRLPLSPSFALFVRHLLAWMAPSSCCLMNASSLWCVSCASSSVPSF